MSIEYINDLETLNKIIQKYYVKNTITNNYILPDAYSRYISDNKLVCISSSANLCLLVEGADFYQLYYYINNQDELLTFEVTKPITMEILYRGEEQRPHEILKYWQKCGFKQHILRVHMMATYNQMKFFDENDSVEVKFAENEKEILFAKKSIEQTFDKYTGHVCSLDEIRFLAQKQNILCAYFDGSLCGVIKFEIKNGVVTWTGFVISKNYRGKGIGTKLMQSFFRINASNQETRYQLWVMNDNKAKFMYERSGFKFDNKFSQSMLKEF